MDSIDTELAAKIRHDILVGVFAGGERLSEAQLCDTYKVSRTPIRLALRILEREGVIQRGEGRGYLVQKLSVEDVIQAVEVRGHLESLGARLIAQRPDRDAYLGILERAIDTIEEQIDELESLGRLDEMAARRAHASNIDFHTTILMNCGNDYVSYTCSQISHLPMSAPGSMVFDRKVGDTPAHFKRGIFRLRIGNAQHRVIMEAIEKGDPVRAEGMMREHSRTMVEYIQTFEKRNENLTVADLISYSEPLGLLPIQ